MGDKSGIEWTDATWNPVTGCSHVSDGCRYCYAETLTMRFAGPWGAPALPWTAGNAAENVILHPERLDVPLRWKKPRTVFVNSMSDLFHEQVPDEYIKQVFEVMACCPQHTFQVLTKRPERMREWFDWIIDPDDPYCDLWAVEWPLPNVWLGVSIESRKHVDRADVLRATPAAHRFISAEPLLGPLVFDGEAIDFDEWGRERFREPAWDDGADVFDHPPLDLIGIDWLIAGGESGDHFVQRPDRFLVDAPNSGNLKPEALGWLRDLRNACEASGTHFMFKQAGGRTPKSGGRLLDGRTHDWTPPRAGEAMAR